MVPQALVGGKREKELDFLSVTDYIIHLDYGRHINPCARCWMQSTLAIFSSP